MSRMVEFPDGLYEQLEEAASAAGTTPIEWIAERLPKPCSNGAGSTARTLADEFAGEIGVFRSGRGDLSERAGELFAEGIRGLAPLTGG